MILRFDFPWDDFRGWAGSCYRDGAVPLARRAQRRSQKLKQHLPALPWKWVIPVAIALLAFANARSVFSPSAVGQSFASNESLSLTRFVHHDRSTHYAWLSAHEQTGLTPLTERVGVTCGWDRLALPDGSFGDWLRHLPMQDDQATLRDYRKRAANTALQERAVAMAALQPNTNKLGAAAMMVRLRAEYLWILQSGGAAAFHFDAGQRMDWTDWSRGLRASFETGTLRFVQMGQPDTSRSSYCAYLESLFQHTSVQSLLDDTRPVTDGTIAAGDILVRSDGDEQHAVMVVDLAVDENGQIAVLLAQGGAPAVTLHLCANADGKPWHVVYRDGQFDLGPNGVMELSSLRRWH